MTDTYELVASGAGPAGESATELAAFFGHRSAVIEEAQPGGTVTTSGGAPTKTLREAALYLNGFCQGDVYGLRMAAPPEVATDTVRKRTLAVCELLQKAAADNIASRDVDYIRGTARLDPDGSVIVSGGREPIRRIRAKVNPDRIRFAAFSAGEHFIRDSRCLRHRHLPRPGRQGDAARSRHPPDCRNGWGSVRVYGRAFREVGHYRPVRGERGARRGGGCRSGSAAFDGPDAPPDTLLFAAGGAANRQGLGLEALGVELDSRRRIVLDQNFRTSVPGIYAAGDVVRPTLASIAMEQGRVAICHAFGIPFEGTVDPCPVSAIYGIPEVSGAGLTEEQCREQGIDYEVGRAELGLTPRGAIAGRGGLLKLIFLKVDRKLIGVHCIGDIASETEGRRQPRERAVSAGQ